MTKTYERNNRTTPKRRHTRDEEQARSKLIKVITHQPELLALQSQIGNRAVQRLLLQAKQSWSGGVEPDSPLVQLQRRRRWRPRQVDPALIDRLLVPNSPLWRQLNPDATAVVNCPAAAAAVDEYLSTGTVRPAPAGDALSTFQFAVEPWSAPTRRFSEIHSVVARRNTFVVVHGIRSAAFAQAHQVTPDHYFVIVNHNGIRGLDAYGQGQVINDLNAFIREQGFERFRYYQGAFRVTHIPFDPLSPEDL